MARLRQQHPQNYVNSGNIHTDFENVIRYINAAELGDKTVGELLAILFNEEGTFRGPVQMRVDSTDGLQYRIGQYADENEGWLNLVSIAAIRGPSGSNAGVIEGPFFYNRQNFQITTGVQSVTITAGGALYTQSETVTVTFSNPDDDTGTAPTATATVNAAGEVDQITIVTPGSGYLTPPTVTISAPQNAQGTQATGDAVLANIAATANVISYNFDAQTEDIVVYKNGLLLTELTSAGVSEYTKDTNLDTVTIDPTNAGVALADKFSIYSVRSQSVTNFRREDTVLAQPASTVPFVHTAEERILVWVNGILQEPGGAADFISSATSNTITFLVTGGLNINDKVTVMTVENQALKTVGGLMFEDEYTNENGLIRYAKLAVEDDEIPQSKVSTLATSLANKANIVSQNNSPLTPATGDLWLDTSLVPAILKFYDGTQWLETSPESSLPTFVQTNAGQYVRVNGTGTSLEYGDIDFSPLVPKTYMGAANGVATLDTAGKLPVGQLPETFSTVTIPFFSVWEDSQAAVGNKTYFVSRLWKQTIRIDGIAYKLNAGTCTIQLSVDGTPVGSTYAVSSTLNSENLATVIEVDATNASRRIELVVTNNSGGQTLEVAIAAATVNV